MYPHLERDISNLALSFVNWSSKQSSSAPSQIAEMTIVHIVLFEFKPTLSRETVVHVSKDSEHDFYLRFVAR